MTDEQRVSLIRDILEQLMADKLTQGQAISAITYVLGTAESYSRAALAVRMGTARLDG